MGKFRPQTTANLGAPPAGAISVRRSPRVRAARGPRQMERKMLRYRAAMEAGGAEQ